MTRNNIFAARLAALRKEKGLTQTELAEDLKKYLRFTSKDKLSFITISSYERGNRLPIVQTLIAIADYFDVSIDYLLGRTDDPTSLSSQGNCDYAGKPEGVDHPIGPGELSKYDKQPVFVEFQTSANKQPVWGVLDFANGCVFTTGEKIKINSQMKIYSYMPTHYRFIGKSYRFPMTLAEVMDHERVWIELINADEKTAGEYNGWYEHNENRTCLINRATGYTLPYYGCGISYAAYAFNEEVI